jgi:hypothetical protein
VQVMMSEQEAVETVGDDDDEAAFGRVVRI